MDIKKEREAFQRFCEENFDFERHEQTYFDEQTQCYENDIGEDTESINMAWSAWLAAKQQAAHKCEWRSGYDGSVFETKCGHTFELSNSDSLADNNMIHCCFCGGVIQESQK